MKRLTIQDFQSYDWQQILSYAEKKERFYYCNLFCEEVEKARASSDDKAEQVFRLLAAITSTALNTDSKKEPFLLERIEQFNDDQLSLFEQIAPTVNDAEMRARLADIVWTRKRKPEMARLAIDSYLESAQTLEDPEQWPNCADRITRAVHIARLLGKESTHFSRAIAHVHKVLSKYAGNDPLLLSAVMMELLLAYKPDESANYAELAEKASKQRLEEKKWNIARRYLYIKTEWHLLAKQPEIARQVRQQIAETYVQQAVDIVENLSQGAPYSHASYHIERAIMAYRDIGGEDSKSRGNELYHVLREYQQKANSEGIPIFPSVGSDLPELANMYTEIALNQVKGKTVTKALEAVAHLPLLQNVTQLREQVDNYVRKSPTALLLPIKIHGSFGQVVARPPKRIENKEEQIAAEVNSYMFWLSAIARINRAQFLILTAIRQINLEHSIRIQDVRLFLIDSPFVPPDREPIFAKGIYAGFTGDYLTAVHLLIPQIENSLRYILDQHGILPSGFDRQDVQNYYDLNRMLMNDIAAVEKLTEILGDDLFFELKGLLVHRAGANLRNLLAHGLLGANEFDSDFHASQSIYLWWLAWHLCFTPVLPSSKQPEKTED